MKYATLIKHKDNKINSVLPLGVCCEVPASYLRAEVQSSRHSPA